jgi:membrane-associated phospholipid phosphatase
MVSMNEDHSSQPRPATGFHPVAQVWRLWIDHRRLIIILALLAALFAVLTFLTPQARRTLLAGLIVQRGLMALLLLFGLLTVSLLWSAGQRLDSTVFLYFNRHKLRGRFLDGFMWGATQIGNGLSGFALAGLVYLIGYRLVAVELTLGIITLWITVEIIKALTDRSRPYLSLDDTKIVGWRERGRSFPSGHTSQTFFMMLFLAQAFDLSVFAGFTLFLVAIVVGFTRIYVGVHYPRDVLAGAILGSVWSILVVLLDPYLARRLF